MKNKKQIKWLNKLAKHDYPGAVSYLNLIYPPNVVSKLIKQLKRSPMVYFKAKDIFRASQLSLLGVSNSHVITNVEKIDKGIALSPILLVRDNGTVKTIIADGYHRMCAVYTFDEDVLIPCKIV